LLINCFLLKRLWQPFYQSIHTISNYNLHKQQQLDLPETNIEEFTLLNNSLKTMVHGVEQDYLTLKEFTSNAAHEMQTPLAVISANTESLIQDEALLGTHHATISSIENAGKRLSRLNQSLLLLAKIESGRFQLDEKVDWDILIKQRLQELKDMTAAQKLQVTINALPVSTVFHEHLADILISNLLGNAIRYNVENGIIEVQLDEKGISVLNTADLPALDETKIFNRFYRHPQTKAEGSGLGLSIVQQVCKLAGYTFSYRYIGGMHVFTVGF
jgi:signal transduction histidine kinase